jgi:hypothetical protein
MGSRLPKYCKTALKAAQAEKGQGFGIGIYVYRKMSPIPEIQGLEICRRTEGNGMDICLSMRHR